MLGAEGRRTKQESRGVRRIRRVFKGVLRSGGIRRNGRMLKSKKEGNQQLFKGVSRVERGIQGVLGSRGEQLGLKYMEM